MNVFNLNPQTSKPLYTMKQVRLFVPVVFTVLILSGCATYHLRQGNHLYDQMAYSSAVTEYEKALSRKEIPEARIKIADSYRMMNNSTKAEGAYAKVVTLPQAESKYKLYYAQSLMQDGKYDEAKKQFDDYLTKMPADQSAMMLRNSCDSISRFMQDSAKYTVAALNINTGESNFSPVYYMDGIVFASDRSTAKHPRIYEWTGRPFLDLYYAKRETDGSWDKPEGIPGNVNGIYHDGPATFSADGNTMYFTRNNYLKKKAGKSSQDVVNIKTYKAVKKDGIWKDIEALPFCSDEYSVGQPSLSSDGSTLYFVSDMPGGLGGTDIYSAKWVNGNWGKPVNLGPAVNTPYNDMFPTIYHNDTLFFASAGHYNMGGLDMFSSTQSNGTWSEAKNLGYPINTSHDDFGFAMNSTGDSGLISSNRNSPTVDNIFSFVKNDLRFTLLGTVVDKETQKPIEGAMVTLINKKTGQLDSVLSDANGFFTFKLNRETDYDVHATSDKYFSNTESVSTVGRTKTEDLTVKLKLEMTHIIINKSYTLNNIYYDLDKSNIRPDAAIGLDSLVRFLKDNPEIKIELSSHTDSRADFDYNMKLSQRRAESAVEYIVNHGIRKDRISAKGYGKTRLVNKCSDGVPCTEEEHQLNRRTEFKVVEAFGMEKDEKNTYKVEEAKDEGRKQKSEEKAYLTVQLKASLTPVDIKSPPYSDVEGIMSDREDKGYYRYSVGRYDNLMDASKKLEELRVKGFKDAFITGRRGGKIISVREALMQMNKK